MAIRAYMENAGGKPPGLEPTVCGPWMLGVLGESVEEWR